MSRSYVLLSGGIDSSTALALACRLGGVTAISVHYGQLHSVEISHAVTIAKHFGAEHRVINLQGAIGKGGLSDSNLVVPNASYEELPKGVSPTYVPFRNGLMLSMLTSLAAADKEAEYVYYGAHAEDAENDAYPDCSVPFIVAMNTAISIGTYGKLALRAPFMDLKKYQIIHQGEVLGVPWSETWSCYKGEIIHCGTCPTCLARIEAFQIAHVKDPTAYKSQQGVLPNAAA